MGIPTVVLISMFFIVTVSGTIYPGVRLSCPAPVDPANGKITKDCKNRPGVVGSTAKFQCNYGYDGKPGVIGSLTCTLDKTGLYWKANINCPIRGCDIFNIPSNSKLDETEVESNVCPDNKVAFECEEGFYMKVRVRCQVGFVLGYTHTCEKDVKKPPPACKNKLDVVFVIDGSSTVGSNYFNHIIKYIKGSIPSWSVQSDRTKIGAVVYATDVGKTFSLTADKTMVEKNLDKLEYPSGQTTTYKGIVEAMEILRKGENTLKVMVVITDGKSQEQAKTKVAAVRANEADGIIMMAMGVGENQKIDELKGIATKPEFVFSVEDHSNFPVQLKKLSKAACEYSSTTKPQYQL